MSRVVLGKVTYTNPSVAVTWTKVLDGNTRRKFASITNASDTDFWLKLVATGLGPPAGTAGTGEFLAKAGFSYIIDNDNMWLGEVWCIHAGTGGKASAVGDGE